MIIEIFSIIFPYIVILYIIDSLQYIRKPTILFVSHFGKKFHFKTSGLHLTKISPMSATVIAPNIPACMTTNGLYKINEEGWQSPITLNEHNVSFISYQDIETISVDGKDVKINGSLIIRTSSAIAANIIKHKIEENKIINPKLRTRKIKETIASTLNMEKIEENNRRYNSDLFNLKLLCTFFFINTFVILPLILYAEFYFYISIYLIIAYMIIAYLIILIVTLLVHKKIYKNEKKQRFHVALSMLFSPFSAAHATNYLTGDLYSHFHYLAVAKSLLPSEMFLNMARKELALIELRKRLIAAPDWSEYWIIKDGAIKKFLEDSGCSVQDVLSPPIKKDIGATHYCPVCQVEYVVEKAYCTDCGVELKKF